MSMQRTRGGEVRTLLCDHQPRCPKLFDGDLGELLPRVRGRARQVGWFCQNSGFGRLALDFCPDHREEAP